MTDVSINISEPVSNPGLDAVKMKEEIIVFYKLGFLDAYKMCNGIKRSGHTDRGHSREARLFERISEKCKKCFEARFQKGITKQIKKVQKEMVG